MHPANRRHSRKSRLTAGFLLLLVACLGPWVGGPARAVITDTLIKRLEAELPRSSNPDSLRLELAIAYRELGSAEARLRALALMDEIEPVFAGDSRFLREHCLTLETCHRFDLACGAAERLLEVAPAEVDIRLVCVRAAVGALIRYDDETFLDDALGQLDLMLAQESDHREALWLKSFLLAYWALRDPDSAARLHREGLACVEKILSRLPEDVPARLFEGVHSHGLGEMERAEVCFRRAIMRMEAVAREAFLRAPADVSDSTGDWRRLDPFPLTVVNEGQLEYWCRMTMADALFGDADEGVRGWETDPGRVLVRYGPPEARQFEPAYLGGGDASYRKYSPRLLNRRHAQDTRLPVDMPLLTWNCHAGGHLVTVKFRDLTLDGSYRATSETRATLDYLEQSLPVSFVPTEPAQIRAVHLLATSFMASAGESRTVITLGFEPAGIGSAGSAPESLVVRTELTDAFGRAAGGERWPVTEEYLCAPAQGLPLAQTTYEYRLSPGAYTLTAKIASAARQSHGTFEIPFTVDAYPPDELALSRLELIRPGTAACPAVVVARAGRLWVPCVVPLAGDDRQLSTYFEIYNLALDPRTGRERYQVRYSMVPRAYAMALESRAEEARARGEPAQQAEDDRARAASASRAEGLAAAAPENRAAEAFPAGAQQSRAPWPESLYFGEPGAQLDETTLTYRNFVDVLFPEERGPGQAGGVLFKVATLPIAGLDVGAYELFVTVRDLVRGQSVTARSSLAIMTDEEIAAVSASAALEH